MPLFYSQLTQYIMRLPLPFPLCLLVSFRIHMDETSAVLSTNSAFYAAFTAKVWHVCMAGTAMYAKL